MDMCSVKILWKPNKLKSNVSTYNKSISIPALATISTRESNFSSNFEGHPKSENIAIALSPTGPGDFSTCRLM